MKPFRFLVSAAVVALAAAVASAHDFWISPASFRAKGAEPLALHLIYGEHLSGETLPRSEIHTERFALIGPDGAETKIDGKEGEDPAGRVSLSTDGTWLAVYRGKRKYVESAAAKWTAYAEAEGLDGIVAERKRLKETDLPGREVFSRCAKTVLRRGDGGGPGFDRVAGLKLEVVPETDPFTARDGDDFTVRILCDGKPLEGALVKWIAAAQPKVRTDTRTNAEGRAKLKLPHAGMWLAHVVHMVRSDPAETGADWESFWGSVTFEIGKREVPQAAAAPEPKPAEPPPPAPK